NPVAKMDSRKMANKARAVNRNSHPTALRVNNKVNRARKGNRDSKDNRAKQVSVANVANRITASSNKRATANNNRVASRMASNRAANRVLSKPPLKASNK